MSDTGHCSTEELEVSVYTFNRLKQNRLDTTEMICAYTGRDLLRLKNFGKKCLKELLAVLIVRGLALHEPTYPTHEDTARHPECPFCCCHKPAVEHPR
jgi:DNA-directed RNA polymerase alpha subunit